MKTTTKALLLLAACALPLLAQQAPPATLVQQDAPAAESKPAPGWLEGLLYNPAERTREGAAALDAGAPTAASEALDAAMRLDPASDKARYNAGTARLLASSEEAAPLLESAAKSTDQALAARAFYNLGNSRLEGEDYKGAIEAYKDSLRRDPASADAKFNLELALRRLQEQQQNQQNQNQQKEDQQKEDQQDQEQQQQGQGQQDQQQEEQQQGEQQKDGQEQQQEKQQEQQGQGDQQKPPQDRQQQQQQGKGEQGPLPQFKDLPDMDAQQAAAILEAIENLERAQRRDDAKKALKANAGGKKDW
jgi:Ca-activated chloride channel family protein